MIKVKKEGIILKKTALEFENHGVLNPGIIKEGNTVHMFYRAVSQGNYSTIGYCELEGPLKVKKRLGKPIINADQPYETHGAEDPRVVKIDNTYYLTYVAYNGINALGALAISKDLIHFEKKGLIVPQLALDEFKALVCASPELNSKYLRYARHFRQEAEVYMWDKDVIFFPRKINDKFCFLQRVYPGIQIVSVTNLKDLTKEFWEDYLTNLPTYIVMNPIHDKHEASYIGGGCPPIETEDGWILIYHGVRDTTKGFVYSACAALLDLNNPQNEIARLPYELFKPDQDWELQGVTDNVVFPTGTALFDDTLYIYYGAADEYIGCASVSLSELLNELKSYRNDK